MSRRGRPPYPDILTPREWEVLALLREGLSNPEIAERMGISRDGVKFHVSEILTKLGVSSREEAASWSVAEIRRPWWMSALAPVALVWRKTGWALGGAMLLAAVAGLGLLAVLLWRSGGGRSVTSSLATPATTTAFASAGGNVISAPDTGPAVGEYTSLTLDAAGNPVVSYAGKNALKVLHCGNPNCTTVTAIAIPDTGGTASSTSIALDRTGSPVVSYVTNGDLKILHCTNADCTASNSVVTLAPRVPPIGAEYTSLALDRTGNPVLSYYYNGFPTILRCGNPDCSAGNTSSIPDPTGAGVGMSLALDSRGNPVVSYDNANNGDLKVLHCGNNDCTVGNQIAVPDSGGVGRFSSLRLDGAGNPIVSYWDNRNYSLKLLHCGDANCSAGNTIVTADTGGILGQYTSLALDAAGTPVVSYWDDTKNQLKVLHCGNADCTTRNVINAPDRKLGPGGGYASLALDRAGNPVISYYDFTNEDLKVLHCGNANCSPGDSVTVSGGVGQYTSLKLDKTGRPVVSYYDYLSGTLKLLHCGNADCTAGNSVTSPDTGLEPAGGYTSLELDETGYPVVSYAGKGTLKVLRCGNADCTAGNRISTPDPNGRAIDTSLVLDRAGNPVVSYQDNDRRELKLLQCGSADCTTGNTVSTPEPGLGAYAAYASLTLNNKGIPIVSYWFFNTGLVVLQCGNADCTSGNKSVSPSGAGAEGGEGAWTSLALDSSGNPVIVYQSSTVISGTVHLSLRVLRCGSPDCTAGNSIMAPDVIDGGGYTSLVLDSAGNPVVSYNDNSDGHLKMLHCGNADCTAGNSISSPDTVGVDEFTSLALDAAGNPVVSYFAVTNDRPHGILKVLHCGNPECTAGNSITAPDTVG